MTPEELAFENDVALDLQQALLGCVTPAFRAVAFRSDASDSSVDLYIALAEPVEEIEDIIYDIEASMEGLTGGSVLIRSEIWIGDRWSERWPARSHRRLFAVRTPSTDQ